MIDINKEWNFIIQETHLHQPTNENLMKREMLFALQLLLSSSNLVTYAILKSKYRNLI